MEETTTNSAPAEVTQTPVAAETPVQSAPEQAAPPVNQSGINQGYQKLGEQITSEREETFAQNFDPNTLTDPNLQQAYKQMQTDYNNKMQQIASQRKEVEKYQQYAPVIDQMLNTQKNQQPINPAVVQVERQLKEAGYSDEAIDMMKIAMGTMYQTQHAEMAQREFTQNLYSGIEKAGQIDQRLNDTSLTYDVGDGETMTFGQIVENMIPAIPNWQQDVPAATKKAIARVDAMINKAKTDGKNELSNQAKQKAQSFPQTNSSPQGAVDTNQSLSIRDAINASLKQATA
jgi:DNA-dependent RNA polymerase auxiliary subunit epsilon